LIATVSMTDAEGEAFIASGLLVADNAITARAH
jgi:hypothetical protein